MAEPGEPLSLPKRQLGYYLRQAREETGMSLAEAAAHIGRSAPTLMRIEKGLTQKLSVPEIEAYCRLYDFDQEKIEAMKGLAQQANTQNWWHEYDDLIPAGFDIYVGLETAAQEIATYQPELIPGLLQTPDYARCFRETHCRTARMTRSNGMSNSKFDGNSSSLARSGQSDCNSSFMRRLFVASS